MRGIALVVALLAAIWLTGAGWILTRVWKASEYCAGESCYQFNSWLDKINFIAMNATAFTWAVTPIVVTLCVFPLLYFVIREIRRRKRQSG